MKMEAGVGQVTIFTPITQSVGFTYDTAFEDNNPIFLNNFFVDNFFNA